jgi:hypothetical protein
MARSLGPSATLKLFSTLKVPKKLAANLNSTHLSIALGGAITLHC